MLFYPEIIFRFDTIVNLTIFLSFIESNSFNNLILITKMNNVLYSNSTVNTIKNK
jgi:hypothetical protein